ncbi:MAG: peptide chain release factor N(5)-glutamine methyltransferase [Patescibacteria group bacterium]
MTSREALLWGTSRLQSAKIKSASLDAEILLAHTLKITKETLFAHPEYNLQRSQSATYGKLIKRRAKHEPVAYITGHKEFYGLDFCVDKRVLIPRPETELMVKESLNLLATSYKLPTVIIDIGTGSGCVIIALAKLLAPSPLPLPSGERMEVRGIEFFATDASRSALTVARKNARLHGVEKNITFLYINLLEPFLRVYSLHATPYTLFITANLPYLPTSEWRQSPPDVRHYEPRLALDGGPDGLTYYRTLLKQLKEFSTRYSLHATYLIFEICPHQSDDIQTLARHYFPSCKIKIKKDLAGLNRLAIIDTKRSH